MGRPALLLLLPILAACGAGPYGHSRSYTPLPDERSALHGAVDFDPVMSERQPDLWHMKVVSAFGVVVLREDLGGGKAHLTLSLRRLEARNLCQSEGDSTCRTTVSAREHGKLRAAVVITEAADAAGEISVGPGSLVRVVGPLAQGNPEGAAPVIEARYLRHWPRGYYVTTAAATYLRR